MVILGALIFGAVLLDWVLTGGQAVFYLLLKITDLVEYLAFWR